MELVEPPRHVRITRGQAFKIWRDIVRGWTQEDLTKRADISLITVQRIESDVSTVRPKSFTDVAATLGTTVRHLDRIATLLTEAIRIQAGTDDDSGVTYPVSSLHDSSALTREAHSMPTDPTRQVIYGLMQQMSESQAVKLMRAAIGIFQEPDPSDATIDTSPPPKLKTHVVGKR